MLQRAMRSVLRAVVILVLAASTFLRNGFWRDDWTLWSDTLAKSPNKLRGYNELGLSLMHGKRYEDAFKVLKRSLELDPYQGPVYINLGIAYENIGRIDSAVRTYESAIWILPSDPAPYYNLGILYYDKQKDRSRALYYFEKARDLDPREPDVHLYLAQIYAEMGNNARSGEEWRLHQQLK